jgi:endo-1,4-beta-xylanase
MLKYLPAGKGRYFSIFSIIFYSFTPKNSFMKKVLFALLSIIIFVACKKTVDPTPEVPPVVTGPETLASASPFPVGCAIDHNLLKNNAAYRDIVVKEYNSITVENVMKWGEIRQLQGTFNFTNADYLVDFAATNKKRVFGHNLLWHSYNPGWLESFSGDSTAFENLMKTHIQTVVTHFKGKVAAWDVVNEAFNENGTYRTNESIWYKKLGKDYIARAFKYAREADPNVLLFYNDYNQESSSSKLDAIISMVNDFKRRGIPIDGLGLQMHISVNTSDNGILNAISESAATGLKIHVSELDVNLTNFVKNPNLTLTDALKEQQKQKYKTIAKFYKQLVPKAQQFGMTNWNVGDADSWLRQVIQKNEYPLLFDENYAKKPAYFGYLEGLKL